MKDIALWIMAFVFLLVGCGASQPAQTMIVTPTTEQTAVPTPDPLIRYYPLDNNTTTFMPDPTLPVVCFYVESIKNTERYDLVWKVGYSAEYTSGLSCVVLTTVDLDTYTEKYKP